MDSALFGWAETELVKHDDIFDETNKRSSTCM